MKTYVAEVDGEAILVFRAADDEAARHILSEEDGGFQLVARGYSEHQRCWVHKIANVLNKVALSVQVNMKADLREIYGVSTRAAAESAIDMFAEKYGANPTVLI